MECPSEQNLSDKLWVILCLVLLVFSGCSRKDSYPNRPVTFICPWAAGGGTDRISRQLAFLLEQELGVPVNVVNATGGGGVTGHSRDARARPDGYTITMVTVELNMLHWRGLTNISHEDFQPVMMVNKDAAALFVRTDSQWSTLGELERAIRENPGKLKASGTAFGGIWHVGLVGWLTKVGLQASDVTWIAMGGSAPSLQELMAGGLDMVACSLPEAQVLLNADKVRCLGVMADQRVPAFPDVFTFKELGVDWQISSYRGVALPLGVPEPRVQVLRDAVARAATSNEYLEYLEYTGAGAAAVPREEFARFLVRTDKTFGDIFAGPSFQGFEHQYGPMFFPALLFGLLVVCLVACFASGSLRRGAERHEISPAAMLDMFVLVGCIILYLLIAEMLGFILSSAAILLILFWRMRLKRTTAVLATVLLVALVYQLFAVFLRVPLPRGWFGW